MRRLLVLRSMLAIAGVPLVSCTTATGAAVPLVRVHAASDLDCPDDEIRITEELGGRYKAVGCGRKAIYRTACEGLNCVVRGEDEQAIPWRDRPEPGQPKPGEPMPPQ